jgi:hypothetical protein
MVGNADQVALTQQNASNGQTASVVQFVRLGRGRWKYTFCQQRVQTFHRLDRTGLALACRLWGLGQWEMGNEWAIRQQTKEASLLLGLLGQRESP